PRQGGLIGVATGIEASNGDDRSSGGNGGGAEPARCESPLASLPRRHHDDSVRRPRDDSAGGKAHVDLTNLSVREEEGWPRLLFRAQGELPVGGGRVPDPRRSAAPGGPAAESRRSPPATAVPAFTAEPTVYPTDGQLHVPGIEAGRSDRYRPRYR